MAPQSKEEFDRQQSVVRKVFDPDTGRTRLVKGTGEVIEEIVSREQHLQINRTSTLSDGLTFMSGLDQMAKSSSK